MVEWGDSALGSPSCFGRHPCARRARREREGELLAKEEGSSNQNGQIKFAKHRTHGWGLLGLVVYRKPSCFYVRAWRSCFALASMSSLQQRQEAHGFTILGILFACKYIIRHFSPVRFCSITSSSKILWIEPYKQLLFSGLQFKKTPSRTRSDVSPCQHRYVSNISRGWYFLWLPRTRRNFYSGIKMTQSLRLRKVPRNSAARKPQT